MYCKNCGNEIKDAGSFCGSCGTPIGQGGNYCANCGSAVIPGAVVCSQCGMALHPACGCDSCQSQPHPATGISDTDIHTQTPYTYAQPPVSQPGKKVMGVVGFVLSILGLLCCCFFLPFNIVGLVFSAVSLKNQEDCKGLAVAGLILNILGILAGVCIWLMFGLTGMMAGFSGDFEAIFQEMANEMQNLTF